MNRLCTVVLLLAPLTLVGCRQASPQFESRPTFPVEGQVLIQGRPAAGVQVFFHAQEPSQRGQPRGVTDPEGRFRLRTYHDGDGAPAGQYTVTAYWPETDKAGMSGEEQLPPDRLGGRYMNAQQSSLRATVNTGPTTLPVFDLK